MLGPCFVMQCFVSFLVFQSFCWGKESSVLYFYCLLDHITVIVLCLMPLPHGAVGLSVV